MLISSVLVRSEHEDPVLISSTKSAHMKSNRVAGSMWYTLEVPILIIGSTHVIIRSCSLPIAQGHTVLVSIDTIADAINVKLLGDGLPR